MTTAELVHGVAMSTAWCAGLAAAFVPVWGLQFEGGCYPEQPAEARVPACLALGSGTAAHC